MPGVQTKGYAVNGVVDGSNIMLVLGDQNGQKFFNGTDLKQFLSSEMSAADKKMGGDEKAGKDKAAVTFSDAAAPASAEHVRSANAPADKLKGPGK